MLEASLPLTTGRLQIKIVARRQDENHGSCAIANCLTEPSIALRSEESLVHAMDQHRPELQCKKCTTEYSPPLSSFLPLAQPQSDKKKWAERGISRAGTGHQKE